MKKSLLVCLTILAFAPDAIAETGDVLLGLSGNFWLVPETKWSLDGNSASRTDKFSGGISLVTDYAVWDYISIGGLFDVTGYAGKGASSVKDDLTMVSFMATARGYYGFGQRGEFMPYLRFAVGYTVLIAPINAPSGMEPKHGWGVKVLPGFQYTFPSNLGLFAEIGWAGNGYKESGLNVMFHSAVINLGISYTFGKGASGSGDGQEGGWDNWSDQTQGNAGTETW